LGFVDKARPSKMAIALAKRAIKGGMENGISC